MTKLHNTKKYDDKDPSFMVKEGLDDVLCSNSSSCSNPSLNIKELREFRLEELAEILLQIYITNKRNEKANKKCHNLYPSI